jgi:hypothetical protein
VLNQSIIHLLIDVALSLSPCVDALKLLLVYRIDWQRVSPKVTSAVSVTFRPETVQEQYVAVRMFFRGGLTQVARSASPIQIIDDSHIVAARQRSVEAVGDVQPLVPVNTYCPIDAANRCRLASETVGARLTRQYGAPEFAIDSPISQVFRQQQ